MGTCHKHFVFSLGVKLSFLYAFMISSCLGGKAMVCAIPGKHGCTPVGNKHPTQRFAFCAGKPRANNEETGILTDWWMFGIKI